MDISSNVIRRTEIKAGNSCLVCGFENICLFLFLFYWIVFILHKKLLQIISKYLAHICIFIFHFLFCLFCRCKNNEFFKSNTCSRAHSICIIKFISRRFMVAIMGCSRRSYVLVELSITLGFNISKYFVRAREKAYALSTSYVWSSIDHGLARGW